MKSTLMFLGAASIVLAAPILVKSLQTSSQTTESFRVDPFSGPLVLEAEGCEVFDKAGNSLKEAVLAKGVLPQGARLNPNCFPEAKAAGAEPK